MGRVVRPASVGEVQALVHAANRNGERLYPVSTGRNWGYGPPMPDGPDCILVDLSAMDRIRNAARISTRHPVAIIEPGVTQGALADFLAREQPQLVLNVTGSARATSILGNALDGGVGYRGPRRQDVFGLEVVTGRGEILRTGFRRLGDDSPLAAAHPSGLGPATDGLFVQSNCGIVTSACLQLEIRPPVEVALSLAMCADASLAEVYEALFRLRRERLLAQVVHLGNRARTQATLRAGVERYLAGIGWPADDLAAQARCTLDRWAADPWRGVVGLGGTRGQVDAALAAIRARLRGLMRVQVVEARRLRRIQRAANALRGWSPARRAAAMLDAIGPLQGLGTGQPTDEPVRALLDEFGEHAVGPADMAHSRVGLVYVNPALPDDGAFVQEFMARMAGCARRFGHELQATINIETGSSAVAVTNIAFDRHDPGQQANADACAQALLELVHGAGLELYRAHTGMMADIAARDPGYWAQLARIKAALDPNGVIAPGRYIPGRADG